MRKFLLGLFVAGLVAFSSLQAEAVQISVINFNDAPTASGLQLIPNGYQNLNWTNFYTTTDAPIEGTKSAYIKVGEVAEISSSADNFSLYSSLFSSDAFTSLKVTAYLDNQVVALRDNNIVFPGFPNAFALNNISVDKVTFQSMQSDVKMDFAVATTPVPEPTSVALGLMGLTGVLGIRKKRK